MRVNADAARCRLSLGVGILIADGEALRNAAMHIARYSVLAQLML
jgi:hypothetical protein